MSYTYKGHTLPSYQEKQWHILIDPLFKQLIDADESNHNNIMKLIETIGVSGYVVEQYDDSIDDLVYVLKTYQVDMWMITKVNYVNGLYMSSYASSVNNIGYNKTDAYANRINLIYTANIHDII